jgi:tRNA A-37 threonylcarbamoyl transferase component Bud32/tetratricopeptide (TPR) repeat protein
MASRPRIDGRITAVVRLPRLVLVDDITVKGTMADSHDSSNGKKYADDDLGLAALGRQIANDELDNLAQEARLTERIFGKAGESVRLGRWILRGHLGRGASGTVHAAHDPELDRTVALKILRPRPDIDPEMARKRLMREAKALARISHPNVIPIFDVISEGDEVYLVMEHIHGSSLREWQEEQRGHDEILDAYVQAARGLACIHEKGLVHRDFKPENALVEKQSNRVRVIDLGLVAAVNEGRAPAERPGEKNESELEDSITRTGTRLGTLAYMAPEQLAGEDAKASSDQFAFCVSLYEAISGQHPFSSERLDYDERLAVIQRGIRPAAHMPSWLTKVLRRGLSVPPDDRYPDMNALVRAIERGRRTRWPRMAAIGAIASLASVVLFMSLRPAPGPECTEEAENAFHDIWNPPRRDQLRGHMLGAGLTEQAWSELEEAIRERTSKWQDAYVLACRDRHAGRTETARALVGLRDACLVEDRRMVESWLQRLARMSAARSASAGDVVAEMVRAATEALIQRRHCIQPESVLLASLPPEDPVVAKKVDELGEELDAIQDRELQGHARDAETAARRVIAEAERIGHARVHVQALYQLGHILGTQDRYDEADAVLRQAAELAAERHGFGEEADTWLYLLKLAADGYQDPVRAGAWLTDVRNALLRSHDVTAEWMHLAEDITSDEAIAAWDRFLATGAAERSYPRLAEYLEARGMLRYLEGKNAEAIVLHRRALAIRQQLPGSKWLVSKSLNNLGNALADQSDSREAQRRYEEGLELRRQLYGPDHPMVAQMHFSIGRIAGLYRGDHERGRQELERALVIQRESFGADDPRLLLTLMALAHNEYLSKNLDRAEEFTARISAIHARLHEARDPIGRRLDRTQEHQIVAAVHDGHGRLAEALAEVKWAIEIFEDHQVQKTRSKQSNLYVWSLHDAGALEGRMKRWREGRPWLERALLMYECCSTADHELEHAIQADLAKTLRALRVEPERARALERAASTQRVD